MDALSLLTASVPSYFVIGPLFIVLIILIVMIGKKDKPAATPSSGADQVSSVTVTPSAQATQVPTQAQPEPEQSTTPQVEGTDGWHSVPPKDATSPVQPQSVAQQTTATPAPAPVQGVVAESALPPVTPNPLPMEHMPQQPELVINHPPEPPSPASIPPISSWKPSSTPTVSSEVLGESEAVLQAHAIVQEPSVAPSTQAPESIQEPAPQIEVPQPVSTDQNPSNVAPTASV